MRSLLLAASLLGSGLCAQNYYIPDNLAGSGTCNVIPFGSTTTTSSFYTCITQQIVRANELGNVPNVITGLGFAACGTGKSRFTSLQVILDHAPANTTLSSTFANNLTSAAVTVLDLNNHVWHTTAGNWMEIGLQDYFVYDGTSDLVIQIIANQSLSPAGFHRSSTHPRVYALGWTGTPPATGTYSGTTAQKMEIGMLTARLSTFGDGCTGSNSLQPTMVISGTPQLGQTVNLDLASAPANGLAFFVLGFGNGFPLPLDLGNFGAPGCWQYVNPLALVPTVTDTAGGAVMPFAIPNSAAYYGTRIYAQWACVDAGANSLGVTTSDYARMRSAADEPRIAGKGPRSQGSAGPFDGDAVPRRALPGLEFAGTPAVARQPGEVDIDRDRP
ncbi:MAG: hypothetical protein KDC98_01700 [Planctomycetes bacterium]|nr:hypothetical protein [Planctomycetota bacterium]